MVALLTAVILVASEILAMVNGKALTRADLDASMNEAARINYHEALADLRDYEHAAVRDFLGRQAIEHTVSLPKLPADSLYARVLASDFDHFDANLRNRIQQQRERVYEIEKNALEELMDRRLFDAAARARGMTNDDLTRLLASQTGRITRADMDYIRAYENSKQQIAESTPPGEERLTAAIRAARAELLKRVLIDSVRTHGMAVMRLEPPRIRVSTANAIRVGPANAPVHVVAFTDFECPFCLESERTLEALRERYPDQVAFEFLNFPLPDHAHARPAAKAALCAAAQGKYAEYHDLLYRKQGELPRADFEGWAGSLGIDRAKFAAALADPALEKRIDADIREGIAAGVNSTPTFLINGRVATTSDALRNIVEEELAAHR